MEALSELAEPTDLRGFCRRILSRGDLGAKLAAPPPALRDDAAAAPLRIERPARDNGLRMQAGGSRLPALHALADSAARALCLRRFAHHELMAVELFAWALLRWPEAPGELRRALIGVIRDEQEHCRLYLARLAELGEDFSNGAHSDYFWKHEPVLDAAPAGLAAFLCAMGLTLEQANLDFSLAYRDAFAAAGDARSAEICDRVHRDEQGHVRLALHWLRRLTPQADDEVAAYEAAVPFPFAASRAKGRRFDTASRAAAGLSPRFIEHVRSARSNPERAAAGCSARVR